MASSHTRSSSDPKDRPDHYDPVYLFSRGQGKIVHSRVGEVDWGEHFHYRAGVIPYTRTPDLLFGFGIDKMSGQLSDFGGWVKYKEKESTPHAALREFGEETLGVFGPIEQSEVEKSIVVFHNKMAIIFLELSVDPLSISSAFTTIYSANEKTAEVSGIVWLTIPEIVAKRGSEVIYKPVGDLLMGIEKDEM